MRLQLAGLLHFDGGAFKLLPGDPFLALLFVNLSLVGEQAGQVIMGAGVLGVEFVGSLEFLAGLLVLLLVVMDDAQPGLSWS